MIHLAEMRNGPAKKKQKLHLNRTDQALSCGHRQKTVGKESVSQERVVRAASQSIPLAVTRNAGALPVPRTINTKNVMKHINRSLLSLGCALLGCVAISAQTTTNLISETTFDASASVPWSYGYFYGNNGLGTYSVQ